MFGKEYFHPFNPAPLKYKPLIVVGPSGVGKSILVKEILKTYGGLFERKISYTTRPKKQYEKGEDQYHFISKEDFMRVSLRQCPSFVNLLMSVASGEE